MILMMTISLCVNLIVLGLIMPGLLRGQAGLDAAFGPDTTARQILTCIYATIFGISVLICGLLLSGRVESAVTLGLGLFAVQIVYKLLTVALIGTRNPVVATNLGIAFLHSVTLAVMLFQR